MCIRDSFYCNVTFLAASRLVVRIRFMRESILFTAALVAGARLATRLRRGPLPAPASRSALATANCGPAKSRAPAPAASFFPWASRFARRQDRLRGLQPQQYADGNRCRHARNPQGGGNRRRAPRSGGLKAAGPDLRLQSRRPAPGSPRHTVAPASGTKVCPARSRWP